MPKKTLTIVVVLGMLLWYGLITGIKFTVTHLLLVIQ